MSFSLKTGLKFVINKAFGRSQIKIPQGNHKLLFLYQGRLGDWNGMGQELYREEPVFRNSINRCHQVCRDQFDFDLLEIYTDKDYLITHQEGHGLSKFMSLATLQYALTDLWRSRGIEPQAVLGMSLGEAGAAYAAGAFSLEEATDLAFHICNTCTYMGEQGNLFFIDISLSEAQKLCDTAPDKIFLMANYSRVKSIIFCALEDAQNVNELIEEKGFEGKRIIFDWAYHTPVLENHRDHLINSFSQINFRPLKVDFYSSTFESEIIKAGTTIDGSYWFEMLTRPSYLGSSLTAAMRDGFNIFLNVGAQPVFTDEIEDAALSLNSEVLFLPSLKAEDGLGVFNRTFRILKKLHI